MSWAIVAGSHGSGEYMLLTNPISVGSGADSDFDIEFEYKITDPTVHARPFGRIGNFYSRVLIFANSNEIRFSGNDGSAANFFPTNYDKTVFNKYRFNRVDKRIYFYLNDVFVADIYLDKAVLIEAIFTQNSGGQERSGAELKYFKMSVNNVDVIHLDASASDHTYTSGQQPVLVDTIGTNHALGMGFDLDASMWVDYGGSSGEEITLTLTTAEQASECGLLSVSQFTALNAVLVEQLTQAEPQQATVNLNLQLSTAEQFTDAGQLVCSQSLSFVLTESEQLGEAEVLSLNAPANLALIPGEQLTQAAPQQTTINLNLQLSATEQLADAEQLSFNQNLGIALAESELLSQAEVLSLNAPINLALIPGEQLASAAQQQSTVNLNLQLSTAEQITSAEQLSFSQSLNFNLLTAQQISQCSLLYIENKINQIGLVTATFTASTHTATLNNVSYTANFTTNKNTAEIF